MTGMMPNSVRPPSPRHPNPAARAVVGRMRSARRARTAVALVDPGELRCCPKR